MIPQQLLCVVGHCSSQSGVSYSHRKIVGSKIIIIIIHNILLLIKLTTLYINTSEPEGQRSEVNATLAHLTPPVKWLPIGPPGPDSNLKPASWDSRVPQHCTYRVVLISGSVCNNHPSFFLHT